MDTQAVFIITGEQGEGKTTKLHEVVLELVRKDFPVEGFIATGTWSEELRTGFHIHDLGTGNRKLLCTSHPEEGFKKIGRFYFDTDTISMGEKILQDANAGILLVIDEVGLFETQGKVWYHALQNLIERSENPLLIAVRKQFVQTVIKHFKISDPIIFELQLKSKEIACSISEELDYSKG